MSTRSVRYSTFNRSIRKGNLASTDRDALAFLEAAQIYNTNQQRAIVNLVRSLKRVGLWSKMKAIYPFVGGTATSHKWNLKDPRDVDAAFRLTFSGGWTHSANGADPNGTNGWADTYLVPSSSLSQNNCHLSYYSREDSTNYGVVIGSERQSPSATYALFVEPTGLGTTYTTINTEVTAGFFAAYTDTNGAAYYIASRTASNSQASYRNATNKQTVASNSDGLNSEKISLASYLRSNTRQLYSDKQCAFATIGDGLTDTDATNLYNIVDLYQRRLGRNV